MAGAVDSFFVGKPNIRDNTDNSLLGREIDKLSEQVVEKFADLNITRDNKTYDRITEALAKENLPKREFNRRLKEELQKHGVPENFSREKGYEGLRGNGSKLVYLENKFRVSYDQSNNSKLAEDIDFSLSPNNHHIKSIAPVVANVMAFAPAVAIGGLFINSKGNKISVRCFYYQQSRAV